MSAAFRAHLDEPPHVDRDFVCDLDREMLRLWLRIEDLEGIGSDEAEVEVVARADPADPR